MAKLSRFAGFLIADSGTILRSVIQRYVFKTFQWTAFTFSPRLLRSGPLLRNSSISPVRKLKAADHIRNYSVSMEVWGSIPRKYSAQKGEDLYNLLSRITFNLL